MDQVSNQTCPICREKKATLTEDRTEIPHFGAVYMFSINCKGCKYSMSDVECEEQQEPKKITFNITDEKDMKVRVIKSSYATVKIPQMRMSVEGKGESSGYVSNMEGLLNRFKEIIEGQRDSAEDAKQRKSAKNLLKKLWSVTLGEQELKVVIEDPSGNSAIISDKAVVEKFKGK